MHHTLTSQPSHFSTLHPYYTTFNTPQLTTSHLTTFYTPSPLIFSTLFQHIDSAARLQFQQFSLIHASPASHYSYTQSKFILAMGITIQSYRLDIGTFNNKLHTHYKLRSSTSSNDSFRFNKNLKIFFLCIVFIIITQNSTYSATLQSTNNKNSHILNGNIKATSIKIAHFNKGNSKFDNKIDDIHYIIDTHKPLIFLFLKLIIVI